MNIYSLLRNLAKSIRAQNIFVASKEMSGIHIFKNTINFSRVQEFYLSWLYSYDMIMRDIIVDKISEKVLTDELYEDSYLLWRRENKYKEENKSQDNKKDLYLVSGKTINFPKRM